MPFAWGTPFELHVLAQARVFGAQGDSMGGVATTMDLTLDGFNIFNAQGQRVNGRILSEAGAVYAAPTANPSPHP